MIRVITIIESLNFHKVPLASLCSLNLGMLKHDMIWYIPRIKFTFLFNNIWVTCTLRELIFTGIKFREFREFSQKSRNLILAKIMKISKTQKIIENKLFLSKNVLILDKNLGHSRKLVLAKMNYFAKKKPRES